MKESKVSLIQKNRTRDELWEKVRRSPEFAVLYALDQAAIAAGGESIFKANLGLTLSNKNSKRIDRSGSWQNALIDIAYTAIQNAGYPLSTDEIQHLSVMKGLKDAEKTAADIRVAMAKDPKMVSIRVNKKYYWWLVGREVPASWS